MLDSMIVICMKMNSDWIDRIVHIGSSVLYWKNTEKTQIASVEHDPPRTNNSSSVKGGSLDITHLWLLMAEILHHLGCMTPQK